MKKLIAILISSSMFLVACSNSYEGEDIVSTVQQTLSSSSITTTTISESEDNTTTSVSQTSVSEEIEDILSSVDAYDYADSASLSDPNLHRQIEDDVYSQLEDNLDDEYEVLGVSAIYLSQEYIEELEYNSQKNIYFGYTIDEIEAQYGDAPYIFTLGDDGTTVVQLVEPSEDHYNEIVRNVAIGTGVILICVTVAIVSGGTLAGPSAVAGATVINTIFATAATDAAIYAVGGAIVSGVTAGIVTGYQTGDYQDALNEGALAASSGFMWGAISGAIIGGIVGANPSIPNPVQPPNWLLRASTIPTPYESEEAIATYLAEQYGDDVITTQECYLGGEVVSPSTPGHTRPDVVIHNPNGTITAVEIKNYDLSSNTNVWGMISKLRAQISSRLINLPEGSTQQIIIDVTGRPYANDAAFLQSIQTWINNALADLYPDITIVFFGGAL